MFIHCPIQTVSQWKKMWRGLSHWWELVWQWKSKQLIGSIPLAPQGLNAIEYCIGDEPVYVYKCQYQSCMKWNAVLSLIFRKNAISVAGFTNRQGKNETPTIQCRFVDKNKTIVCLNGKHITFHLRRCQQNTSRTAWFFYCQTNSHQCEKPLHIFSALLLIGKGSVYTCFSLPYFVFHFVDASPTFFIMGIRHGTT